MSFKANPTVLVFSPYVGGGLAEHIFYQSRALEKAGAKVICLVAPSFLNGRPVSFKKVPCLRDPPTIGRSRFVKRIKLAWSIVYNQWVLAWNIIRLRPDLVLLSSYAEYVAPFWVWPHWLLAKLRIVRYAANLHDPMRTYIVGPAWWHKLSGRMAYLPLDFVLVHDRLPEPSPVPRRVSAVVVPVGVYEITSLRETAQEIRRNWGVIAGQKVFLAFGYVRDGKNLDLAVRALTQLPGAFLVVAGSVASPKQKQFSFYRELAAELGVASRCQFIEGFVSDEELGNYFAGADFVLLTYSASFHSQSGVLNIAARARKPVLASASPSPLIESVRKFRLGITVEPDSASAVVEGMRQLMSAPPIPQWEDYEATASWAVNARGILDAAGFKPESRP